MMLYETSKLPGPARAVTIFHRHWSGLFFTIDFFQHLPNWNSMFFMGIGLHFPRPNEIQNAVDSKSFDSIFVYDGWFSTQQLPFSKCHFRC